MPSRAEIVLFDDSPPPPGASPWVAGAAPATHVKHRILRDWLRGNPGERDRYAAAKREAAFMANAAGEHVLQYNARKQQDVREIYHRAFVAAGLLET
jgi:GrpB protein